MLSWRRPTLARQRPATRRSLPACRAGREGDAMPLPHFTAAEVESLVPDARAREEGRAYAEAGRLTDLSASEDGRWVLGVCHEPAGPVGVAVRFKSAVLQQVCCSGNGLEF